MPNWTENEVRFISKNKSSLTKLKKKLEGREKLREFFEIDSNHIAYNALIACGLNKKAKDFKNRFKLKLNKESPFVRWEKLN